MISKSPLRAKVDDLITVQSLSLSDIEIECSTSRSIGHYLRSLQPLCGGGLKFKRYPSPPPTHDTNPIKRCGQAKISASPCRQRPWRPADEGPCLPAQGQKCRTSALCSSPFLGWKFAIMGLGNAEPTRLIRPDTRTRGDVCRTPLNLGKRKFKLLATSPSKDDRPLGSTGWGVSTRLTPRSLPQNECWLRNALTPFFSPICAPFRALTTPTTNVPMPPRLIPHAAHRVNALTTQNVGIARDSQPKSLPASRRLLRNVQSCARALLALPRIW